MKISLLGLKKQSVHSYEFPHDDRQIFPILIRLLPMIILILIPLLNFSSPLLHKSEWKETKWENARKYLAGPVTNLTSMAMFPTIQAAIDDAGTLDGDIIEVAAGSYTEILNINKSLIFQGPNVGVGGDATRVSEAILLNCSIDFNAAGTIILDGFHILRNDGLALDQIILDGAGTNTVQNCLFERNGMGTGVIARAITTSAGGGAKNILNNKFTGDDSGGLFSGHKTWNNGIYINGGSALVSVMGNTITLCRSAINVDDFNVNAVISGNTLDNNGTHLSLGGTVPTSGSFVLGSNDFINSPASTMINLSNVAEDFRLNITSSTLQGVTFSSLSDAELFEVEARMAHKEVSASKKGKVTYVADNQYVNNYTTPFVKIDKIQNSIKYADPDEVINLQAGEYNEKLTIDVSDLTLQGISNDKFLYVIDGTGVISNNRGIEILGGMTNINIKNLTIQDFTGTSGNIHGAIYANGPNNDNLLIDNVALLNNASCSGFYANGPIDGLTFTNSMVANHGPGARGIVVWNGFKQNIIINDNMVTNNNCCGIELQDGSASAVDISGNTIDIGAGDNAIGVVGLDGTVAPNSINNNIITGGGRFGIEVKNPAGEVTVDGNQVTFSGSSDVRDKGGIVVIRRAVLGSNVDVPNGVTITNNTVTGYTQGSTSEGFAIVIEGTNHIVTSNTLNNNDIGIQQQAGHLPYPGDGDQANLADNFFGRGNSPATCGNVIMANNFSGNGIDTRDVGVGDGIVNNMTTGKSFCSIQAAIDDVETLSGHTIVVGEGTYTENVIVNKSVIIHGPNVGISPNTGSRVAEAIVYPASSAADAIFTIAADDVQIEGLTLDGDNPNIATGWPGTNGADLDVYDGIVYYDPVNALVVQGLQVKKNIIKNVAYFGVDIFGWDNFNNPSTSAHLVDDNLFADLGTYTSGVIDFWGGGVLIYNDNYTRIVNNTMTNVRIGIQTGNFHDPNPGNSMYQVIDNNTIEARRRGIFYNLHTGGSVAPLTVSNNIITGITNANETVWDGILMASLSDAVGQVIGNSVDGSGMTVPSEGLEVWNVNTNAPVFIQGGSVSNVDIGIFVNNYEGYSSNASNTDCVIDQVDLTTGLEKGIYIKDSPSNTNGSSTHATVMGNSSVTTNDISGIGILIEGADASANIEGNLSTISGNDIGILVDEGIAIISENSITANNSGVRFQNAGTGTVNQNNITGNTSFGVDNLTGVSVDATLNWWGDASGPSGAGAGSGDAVSPDVDFCTWLASEYTGGPLVEAGPVTNLNTSASYCSIQDAIDNASAMDVIQINEADYTEASQIVVSTSVTLQGLGKNSTILRPGINTGASGDTRGFILVQDGIEFHLKDLTIDGTGKLVYQAIRHKGNGTIDNVAFVEIKYNESGPNYQGTAVAAFGTGNVDVSNSMFSEIGRVGVLYFEIGITGSLFENNIYTGKGAGDWLDYALDISAGAVVNVMNNTISDNLGIASTDASTSAGILVTTFFGVGTNATITENSISNSSTGIFVGFDGSDLSTVVANYNNLSGNSTGIQSTNPQVDGMGNWWGDASGPSGEGPGTGDAVSTNVDFCGWLVAPFDGSPDPVTAGIPDPELITTIQACSDESYSFDLDDFLNNATMEELGQVTYIYDVTVVPDVNVLFPDPRQMNVSSGDGEIINTITNFGSQALKVRYTIIPTSEYGCVGPEFVVDVVINLNPQVDIIPSSASKICPNTTHMVSGTVVPGATYSFLWEILEDPSVTNNSSISPANAQSANLHIASDALEDTLKIKLTATNLSTGCVGQKIYAFVVNCTDIPPCQEDTIDLSASYLAMDPHQAEFQAIVRLAANGLITSSNMEIISFKAGTEVELESTFEVQQGAVLNVEIEDCVVPADVKPRNKESTLTKPKG